MAGSADLKKTEGAGDYLYDAGSDEWKTAFSGDFYREEDNVCRGVTIGGDDGPFGTHHGLDQPKLQIDGDYYQEKGDMTGGYALKAFEMEGEKAHPFQKDIGYGFDAKIDDVWKEGDVPPPQPNDPFFRLEATTLIITSSAPHKIGNSLNCFFTETVTEPRVVSDVTKVTSKKFAIKADVFDANAMMCSLKARVYKQAESTDRYAIEFQRRNGDAMTFSTCFQQASVFFASQCSYSKLHTAVNVPISVAPPLPLEMQTDISEADINPLLDLVYSNSGDLQAEAASSLKTLAEEGKSAVRSKEVFQAASKLMENSSTDVAYPTACLLTHLARQPEAAPFFVTNVLQQMLDKVQSKDLAKLSRRQFAEAFYAASQSVNKLQPKEAALLIKQIEDMKDTQDAQETWGPDVNDNLDKAKRELSRRT